MKFVTIQLFLPQKHTETRGILSIIEAEAVTHDSFPCYSVWFRGQKQLNSYLFSIEGIYLNPKIACHFISNQLVRLALNINAIPQFKIEQHPNSNMVIRFLEILL